MIDLDTDYWRRIGAQAFSEGKKMNECPFDECQATQRTWWMIGWTEQQKTAIA